jgi:plasmid stabilization system protein ParE
MRVVFSALSRSDLRSITTFIGADSPARARTFLAELQSASAALAEQPLRFALMVGYEAQGYRRRPYGPYSIIYLVEDERITVVRVLHAAMDLNAALGD